MYVDPPPGGRPADPLYRGILALDIVGSTLRTNTVRARLRADMYTVFEAALCRAGINEHARDPLVDRGDGVLALVHPVAPKTRLLDTVVPTMRALMTDHDTGFQLRMVIHAGEVHYDRNGCFGEALDVAFRLLDAQPVRDHARETVESLAVVVSDDLYRTVVCHGYVGIDPAGYKPAVQVAVGGVERVGWIQDVP
jgi:hypothetical protein